MKILEWHKVFELDYFQLEFKSFLETLFISLNRRSRITFTLGFCDEFEVMEIKMQDECFGKVLLFPLIQLLKSLDSHTILHNQSHNNQTNNHNHLLNITFQNLEF